MLSPESDVRLLAQAHIQATVLAAAVFEPDVDWYGPVLGFWSWYRTRQRLRDGRALSRNALLAVTDERLHALEVRGGLRRWYVWGSLGDWPREKLSVRVVNPKTFAITWTEPGTGTVREMRPVARTDSSREVVDLLTDAPHPSGPPGGR